MAQYMLIFVLRHTTRSFQRRLVSLPREALAIPGEWVRGGGREWQRGVKGEWERREKGKELSGERGRACGREG